MTTEQEIRLGHYAVIEEVGRGGMGIVYKAQDLKLNRIVALKVMVGENAQSAAVQRFIREAKTIAKLNHPNIINVLDVGWEGNYYFFAMDFINGCSLDDAIGNRLLTYNSTLEILVTVAKAIDFAHKNGVIHRDLKPANVMLDSQKKPIIMDFGVALSLDESVQLSRSNVMVGTIGYMSPEQLEGKRGHVDRRSDIYSLGVIMYKMLTRRDAFFGTSAQIINKVRTGQLIPLHKIKGNLPKDLQYICSKAMANNRNHRYANAAEMARDIQLVQQGKKVKRKDSFFMKFAVVRDTLKHKKNLHSYVLWLVVVITGFILGANFSPVHDMPHNWTTSLWSDCWNGHYVDFSAKKWRELSLKDQQLYARSYQTWYANKVNVPQEFVHKTGVMMILIPPGKFIMGSSPSEKGHQKHELEREETIFAPYYIAKYEISVAQWDSDTKERNKLHPISNITWEEARDFCVANGMLLPREVEWEYACRAGTTTPFATGNDLQTSRSIANVTNEQGVNSWGCSNMHHNVREWCRDKARSAKNVKPVVGDAYFKLPSQGNIMRGGSWGGKNNKKNCRSAARFSSTRARTNIGFRPILSLSYLVNKQPNIFLSTPFVTE
ncbi:bifunctional serine/threonine-protein kinase/formylglycine-generating enzyme family protein [Candidatus Uabimicrobium amorphum]|uniref:Protein kinase n=1 Tax=Uabimicrobium amorphum TaxID=2596890 RepID=A0A5S9F1X4_UABAM|nr:bifunctional serine/threonine-protein kinase/formylglycine-generating enzyme family protein [Candidatus Uabimicrobium amorphum]BBM82651.1 protein kinase [Candidatus Uabimicrobium amorphum]